MSAAIVCPAVCFSDVVNKAGIYGKSIQNIMSQSFSCSSLVKSEPTWLHPEGL